MFLHEHRILHGDLKAANVLLQSSTADRRHYISKVWMGGVDGVCGQEVWAETWEMFGG